MINDWLSKAVDRQWKNHRRMIKDGIQAEKIFTFDNYNKNDSIEDERW